MSGSPGHLGGVSVRGSSHEASRMPNQDAFGCDQDGEWHFLAVADGHGSARHYRSDRGSVFAVHAAIGLLRLAVREMAALGTGPVLSRLAHDLVEAWRGLVEADIRSWPVREPSGFESLAVYGSTCVAAAIGPGLALFLQIGDGDVLAAGPGGDVERAIPLDPDLIGPGTYSLCQPDAADRTHVRLFAAPHPLSSPDFVMAVTDGLSKSYRDDADFVTVPRHLRDQLRTAALADVLKDLEPWLGECSRRGSRDDITLAVYSAVRSRATSERSLESVP